MASARGATAAILIAKRSGSPSGVGRRRVLRVGAEGTALIFHAIAVLIAVSDIRRVPGGAGVVKRNYQPAATGATAGRGQGGCLVITAVTVRLR
ncbi:hypothetical protein [Actinoplanes flavus]|uniref:Uncharacterized protein n=1 Tax=Actinoplanes flavus TaxID=2820290 RepID=A0ABS3UF22_9ACTN|nr:hypothetical protein [Actinoplanes flavus]MBO3737051.1 hypothetical protein [Actinoplanes flavus]